jgi:hypothetical protein
MKNLVKNSKKHTSPDMVSISRTEPCSWLTKKIYHHVTCEVHIQNRNKDSIVSIAIRLWAGQSRVLFLAGARDFSPIGQPTQPSLDTG